jgi:hypothetical protein
MCVAIPIMLAFFLIAAVGLAGCAEKVSTAKIH